jgi:hypothetical protein
MSDTPISDSTPHNVAELGMLCRRLERELTAANERIKRLEKSSQQLKSLNNKICEINLKVSQERHDSNVRLKRLEAAGDEAIYPCEYAARVRIWTEAKEAKL